MAMEHRCTGRSKASRDVLIHTCRGNILNGSLRNVSSEGMYLQTDVQDIQKCETVDIELTTGCCIRGWIAHIGDDGVGVLLVPPLADEIGSPSPPVPLSNACLKCIKFDNSTINKTES